jgi:hypothetical protein
MSFVLDRPMVDTEIGTMRHLVPIFIYSFLIARCSLIFIMGLKFTFSSLTPRPVLMSNHCNYMNAIDMLCAI